MYEEPTIERCTTDGFVMLSKDSKYHADYLKVEPAILILGNYSVFYMEYLKVEE